MSKVLISYHSFSGKTRALAEASAEGAKKAGAEAVVKEVGATGIEDLKGADAWLVATPQTFRTMAGETKRLFERLWPDREQIAKNTAFSFIICHMDEPAATVELMEKFAGYFGLAKANDGLIINVAELGASKERCWQLGATLAGAGQR